MTFLWSKPIEVTWIWCYIGWPSLWIGIEQARRGEGGYVDLRELK